MIIDRILKWLGFRKEKKVLEEVREVKKEIKKRKKKTKKEMVVEYLKKRKTPAKVEEIAKKVGTTIKTTRRYLYYLAKEGKVEKKKEGWVAK